MYDTLQERTGFIACPFLFILNYASVYLESVSSIYESFDGLCPGIQKNITGDSVMLLSCSGSQD